MPHDLKAGAATANITPPLGTSLIGYFHDRKCTEVHDELHAKALVLDNGETPLAIVVCDVCLIERADLDQAKKLAEARTGIPAGNMLISTTHTHTGPATVSLVGIARDEAYCAQMVRKIADSIALAKNRLRPAEIGYGVGREPRCVFNRRYRMKDGTVKTNPGVGNPDVMSPSGPTDPDVGVLAVREAGTDRLISLIGNYALHYVGAEALSVSADYFGIFSQMAPQMLGQPFVAMMANGCCGDINNVDVFNPRPKQKPYEQTARVARVIAAEAVKTCEFMTFSPTCTLAAASEFPTFALRQWPEKDPEKLKAHMLKIGIRDTLVDAYLFEARELAKLPQQVETQVQALVLNDLAIVGLPGEIFCQFGLDIKQRSPFKHTFVIELANDWVGYIPTRKAHEEGGYEVWLARSSKLEPAAGDRMVEAALRLLAKMRG